MTNAEISAFLAICDGMNISKAAEKLFISQSSLSTRIKALEKELGCTLLVRGRGQHKIMLTDAGAKFYELALKYEDIVSLMMALRVEENPEKFRVSTLSSIATYLFPPAYDRFIEKTKNTILEVQDLEPNAAYGNLAYGNTDIAFLNDRREHPRVISYPAFSEALSLVCSENAEYGDVVTKKDLDVKEEIYIPWSESFVDWHSVTF